MISKESDSMVRLAAAANPFDAHIWEQALLEEGIQCQVLGDYLGGGIGNIPGMMAELWVEASNLERAETILCQHPDRVGAANSDEQLN